MFEFSDTIARSFNGTSHYLYQDSVTPFAATAPGTLAMWFQTPAITTLQRIFTFGNSGTNDPFIAMGINSSSKGIAFIRDDGVGGSEFATGNSIVANRWSHLALRMIATNSRAVYLNGDIANKGTNTTANISITLNRMAIGALYRTGVQDYANGRIAWPAMWSVCLSEAEISALAAGACPLDIQPASLIGFWQWSGGGVEYSSKNPAYALTNSGSAPIQPGWEMRRLQPRGYLLAAGATTAAAGNRRRRMLCV